MSATLNPFIEKARRANPFIEKARRASSSPVPDDPEGMLELLGRLSDEELAEMVRAQQELEDRLSEFGPQDDDELHAWIKAELGIDIPRKAVCPNHDPPFNLIADLYFERVDAVLAMANRSGGKTIIVAILHWINSLFKPGCESCTFGATEQQSLRCYAHLKGWVYDRKGEKRKEVVSSLMRETIFENRSTVEILPGTPQAVNGPHPQKAHADEVELMDDGTWKESQPIDTPVATPDGWKEIGSLRLGDYVFGRDGKPTRVTKIRDYGVQQVYRIVLTDGRTTECCGDHLWTVAGNTQRSRCIWKVMRTSNLIASGLKVSSGYKFGIPKNEVVDFNSRDELPLHPYVLGVLLGDGYLGGTTPAFRTGDREISDRVDDLLGDEYFVSRNGNQNLICRAYAQAGFKTVVGEIGLDSTNSFTKFIPDRYKFASRIDRLELLRGLMDTDGCAIEGSSVAQFGTVSEVLAKGLREVVFSLGGRAILRRKNFKTNWSLGVLYTLDISFSDGTIPFSLSRKVLKMVSRQRTLDPSIKLIEPSRLVEVRCIGVDNADSTYLTTDYIVTHNSRNMTISKRLDDGRLIKPQDICTSTRKGPNGRMQKLIDEITDAIAHGYKPPRKLYQWCLKETASQVPNCQMALPNLPEDKKCSCHLVRKGEWDEKDDNGRPKPRLLKDICNGDFYKSRGWQPFGDVVKQFMENDRETFEVQQLCLKPEMQFHYLPKFSEEKHCIRNYKPDPMNGPIFTSTDWGGSNPHAVNWYQYLLYEIEVEVWVQPTPDITLKRRIKKGSIIAFDEIYKAEIGNTRLGQLVKLKEATYRRELDPKWQVTERFADPQGKAARLDWKKMGLKTSWHITREFDEHIKVSNDLFDEDLFFVDGEKCPMWVREAKEWRRHHLTGQQLDVYNHCMSNYRYAIANIRKLHPPPMQAKEEAVPMVDSYQRESVVTATVRKPEEGPLGFAASHAEDEFARWRQGLGQPVRRPF